MITKTMLVFYDANCLPFKDKERTIHFPILGGGFQGASNTTHIRFYIDQIGTPNDTWVAMAKLPNGKIGYKILSTYLDSELNENYAELVVENWFTQAKGDVYISLQGYEGGVQLTYNSETELYDVNGTPTIQATGSVKLTIMYATSLPEDTDMVISLSDVLALAGDKLDTDKGIVVIANTSVSVSGYDDNQIFYCLADNSIYKKVSGVLSLIFTAYSKTESDNKYFINASNNTASGNNTFSGQNTFSGRAVFSGNANLYNTYLTTNTKNYFARVGTTTNQYVMYKLPYSYSDLGSEATYTLITKEYTDTQLALKVDKTTTASQVYATNYQGNQTTIGFSSSASGTTIALRDSNGQLNVALTPTANNSASSKKYVYDYLNLKADKATTLSGYGITNAYTKTEVDSLIDNIESGEITLVNTTTYPTLNDFLATTGQEGVIYLYPIDTNDLSKGYYRYVWETIGGTPQWVSLGTTEIDLSDYYTKTETDTLLGAKADDDSVVHLTGNETITGQKTFKGDLKFVGASYTSEGVLTTDNSYAYLGYAGANTLYAFNGQRFINNSGADLGSSSRKWKDLYLSGVLSDGTYTIAIANIQEKITNTNKLASDLVDSTNQTNQFANDVGLSVVGGKLCITYEE